MQLDLDMLRIAGARDLRFGRSLVESKLTDFLKDAAGRQPDDRVVLTIRELLAKWGAKRRGYWVAEQISRDLRRAGLATQPPFIEGWIDNTVTLVPVTKRPRNSAAAGAAKAEPRSADIAEAVDAALPEVALRIGSLPSANTKVVDIPRDASLQKAQSVMMRYDYSQLAVMSSPRSLCGAVTWESIATARVINPNADLKAATVKAETVLPGDDLLSQIPRVMQSGFVFVVAPDKTLQGIVTTADLSQQFAELAGPFFVVAEIERRLRRVVNRTFSKDEIKTAANPADESRRPESADDLTLGECVRLLGNPSSWPRLSWHVERNVFIDALKDVTAARNEIMHFSPDPLDADQLASLHSFARWMRVLDADR